MESPGKWQEQASFVQAGDLLHPPRSFCQYALTIKS